MGIQFAGRFGCGRGAAAGLIVARMQGSMTVLPDATRRIGPLVVIGLSLLFASGGAIAQPQFQPGGAPPLRRELPPELANPKNMLAGAKIVAVRGVVKPERLTDDTAVPE